MTERGEIVRALACRRRRRTWAWKGLRELMDCGAHPMAVACMEGTLRGAERDVIEAHNELDILDEIAALDAPGRGEGRG